MADSIAAASCDSHPQGGGIDVAIVLRVLEVVELRQCLSSAFGAWRSTAEAAQRQRSEALFDSYSEQMVVASHRIEACERSSYLFVQRMDRSESVACLISVFLNWRGLALSAIRRDSGSTKVEECKEAQLAKQLLVVVLGSWRQMATMGRSPSDVDSAVRSSSPDLYLEPSATITAGATVATTAARTVEPTAAVNPDATTAATTAAAAAASAANASPTDDGRQPLRVLSATALSQNFKLASLAEKSIADCGTATTGSASEAHQQHLQRLQSPRGTLSPRGGEAAQVSPRSAAAADNPAVNPRKPSPARRGKVVAQGGEVQASSNGGSRAQSPGASRPTSPFGHTRSDGGNTNSSAAASVGVAHKPVRGPERFFYDTSGYTGCARFGGPTTVSRREKENRPGLLRNSSRSCVGGSGPQANSVASCISGGDAKVDGPRLEGWPR